MKAFGSDKDLEGQPIPVSLAISACWPENLSSPLHSLFAINYEDAFENQLIDQRQLSIFVQILHSDLVYVLYQDTP